MLKEKEIQVNLAFTDRNKLEVKCNVQEPDCTFLYEIYRDGELVDRSAHQDGNTLIYWATKTGAYSARVYVKDGQGKTISKLSGEADFDASVLFDTSTGVYNYKWGFLASIKQILIQVFSHLAMIFYLAKYDYKLENKDSYLGKLWSILTPLLQIGTFWFVFGVGIRNRSAVDGHPFLIWMVAGLIPWYFMNNGIMKGANSIYSNSAMVTRIKFPISVMPVVTTMVCFFEHLVNLCILLVMLFLYGYFPKASWIGVLYYMLYTFVFLMSFSLLTSTLTAVARDFQKLLAAVMRMIFYVTPILWTTDKLPETFQKIINLSPITYVINGFRESLLYEVPFYAHWQQMPYFWLMALVLFALGCKMQMKFANKFIDIL